MVFCNSMCDAQWSCQIGPWMFRFVRPTQRKMVVSCSRHKRSPRPQDLVSKTADVGPVLPILPSYNHFVVNNIVLFQASMAWKRSSVRSRSGPPITFNNLAEIPPPRGLSANFNLPFCDSPASCLPTPSSEASCFFGSFPQISFCPSVDYRCRRGDSNSRRSSTPGCPVSRIAFSSSGSVIWLGDSMGGVHRFYGRSPSLSSGRAKSSLRRVPIPRR